MTTEQQTPHNWVASPYGHGEWACTFCLATNREIAVIGDPNHCPDRAARGGLEYRAGNYVQAAQTDEEDDYRARIAAALDPAVLARIKQIAQDEALEEAAQLFDGLGVLRKMWSAKEVADAIRKKVQNNG